MQLLPGNMLSVLWKKHTVEMFLLRGSSVVHTAAAAGVKHLLTGGGNNQQLLLDLLRQQRSPCWLVCKTAGEQPGEQLEVITAACVKKLGVGKNWLVFF